MLALWSTPPPPLDLPIYCDLLPLTDQFPHNLDVCTLQRTHSSLRRWYPILWNAITVKCLEESGQSSYEAALVRSGHPLVSLFHCHRWIPQVGLTRPVCSECLSQRTLSSRIPAADHPAIGVGTVYPRCHPADDWRIGAVAEDTPVNRTCAVVHKEKQLRDRH